MLFDFDDLLVEVNALLKEDAEARDKYRSTYRHILFDEFQDSTPAQLEAVKLLIGDTDNGSSFWVCGDLNQSIFSFAGASINNILNFNRHFPKSKEFMLSINYRSTPQIVKASLDLIAHNKKKKEQAMQTVNESGEDVCILESSTEEDEAEALVREINDLVQVRGFPFKDIAVLYRANFLSRVVEEVFSAERIPYHIENGLNFYDRSEVKVMLNYLRLIAHPDTNAGDEALLSVINIPNRYIGRKFISELEEQAEGKELHLFSALKSMRIPVPYVRNNVKDLLSVLNPLIKKAKKTGTCEMIQTLSDCLDYDKWVADDDIPSPDDVKIQNLNQLQLAAAKYPGIDSFLESIESFQGDSSHDKNGVSLMTIHKSKGMQFPVVFVIGLLEGILPTKKGDIEEERRICFVGVSRAMKLLYLSYCNSYFGQSQKKSPFIDEITGKAETLILKQ